MQQSIDKARKEQKNLNIQTNRQLAGTVTRVFSFAMYSSQRETT